MSKGPNIKTKTNFSMNVGRVKNKMATIVQDDSHNQIRGETPWDVGPGIKTLKLAMVLLIYLYSSDDHKISIFEKRSFNKAVKSIEFFTEKDKNDLKDILNLLPDTNYVLGYIRKWQLSKDIVMASIDFLKNEIGLNSQDLRMINIFKKQYSRMEELVE